MRTPLFQFRCDLPTQRRIREVAQIFGASSPADFMRQLVRAIIGTDQNLTLEFTQRLGRRLTDQMQLELVAAQERAARPRKRAQKGRKGAGRGR